MNTNPLIAALEQASEVELDLAFALLKYREIGIYRKVRAMCMAFQLDFDEVISTLPQQDGRLLDKETRHFIHEPMLARARALSKN